MYLFTGLLCSCKAMNFGYNQFKKSYSSHLTKTIFGLTKKYSFLFGIYFYKGNDLMSNFILIRV